MKSALAIAFDYVPSRRIVIAVALVTALAVIAALACALPWPARIAIALGAAGHGGWSIARHLRPRCTHIAFGAAGWRLLRDDRAEHAARLLRHARIGPLLTLDFRLEDGNRFRAAFAGDNLDAECRRRLTLLLARAEVLQGS
jgi:hypothetical protein